MTPKKMGEDPVIEAGPRRDPSLSELLGAVVEGDTKSEEHHSRADVFLQRIEHTLDGKLKAVLDGLAECTAAALRAEHGATQALKHVDLNTSATRLLAERVGMLERRVNHDDAAMAQYVADIRDAAAKLIDAQGHLAQVEHAVLVIAGRVGINSESLRPQPEGAAPRPPKPSLTDEIEHAKSRASEADETAKRAVVSAQEAHVLAQEADRDADAAAAEARQAKEHAEAAKEKATTAEDKADAAKKLAIRRREWLKLGTKIAAAVAGLALTIKGAVQLFKELFGGP
jgi:chromosome segregation ATPase